MAEWEKRFSYCLFIAAPNKKLLGGHVACLARPWSHFQHHKTIKTKALEFLEPEKPMRSEEENVKITTTLLGTTKRNESAQNIDLKCDKNESQVQ